MTALPILKDNFYRTTPRVHSHAVLLHSSKSWSHHSLSHLGMLQCVNKSFKETRCTWDRTQQSIPWILDCSLFIHTLENELEPLIITLLTLFFGHFFFLTHTALKVHLPNNNIIQITIKMLDFLNPCLAINSILLSL